MLIKEHFQNENDWLCATLQIYRLLGRCQKCDYQLKGSTSPTCPECGSNLQDQIQQLTNTSK